MPLIPKSGRQKIEEYPDREEFAGETDAEAGDESTMRKNSGVFRPGEGFRSEDRPETQDSSTVLILTARSFIRKGL